MTPRPSPAEIEPALLQPSAGEPVVDAFVADAATEGHSGVWVLPRLVARAVRHAAGRVPVGTVIGFPLGANRATVKAIEATAAVKDGAGQLLVVPFLPDVLAADTRSLRDEILEIVRAARAARPTSGILVLADLPPLRGEAGDDQVEGCIAALSLAARQGGADGIVVGSASAVDGSAVSRHVPVFVRESVGVLKVSAMWEGNSEDGLAALAGGATGLIRVVY